MDQSVAVLIGSAGAALTALAAFSAYRWQQRERLRAVRRWVKGYLLTRFGEPLDELNITCTDDRRWPVLASCNDPRTRIRHRLRFSGPGSRFTFALLSEEQEGR
jgi:hypothetical protein